MSKPDPKPLESYETATYSAMIAKDLRTHGPAARETVLHRLRNLWGLREAEAERVLASALGDGWLLALDGGRLGAGASQPLPNVPWGSPSRTGKRYKKKP